MVVAEYSLGLYDERLNRKWGRSSPIGLLKRVKDAVQASSSSKLHTRDMHVLAEQANESSDCNWHPLVPA